MEDVNMESMGRFDKTFNMAVNIRLDKDKFDWLNNPYITPHVYHVDENFVPKLSETVKFKHCDKSDLLKLIPETDFETFTSWFGNTLCFQDKNKIKLESNWYNIKYDNIFISLDYC